jgi:pimeloyl-ACP methyl ester carboxylesterase
MMLEVIQVPPNEVEFLRSSPVWKERLAVAHTLPREFRGANAYRLDAARVRGLMNPTLLLLGGNSPAVFRDPIRVLGATLPRGETVVLEGQRHNAIDSAPLMFAQTVKAFLGNI